MEVRILVAAAIAVAIIGTALFRNRAEGRSPGLECQAEEKWSLHRLWLASFLTLFAELALIRWLAVEIRIFAYVKNLALLLCFLGFGLGCALAKRRPRYLLSCVALLGLLFIVFGSPARAGFMEQLSQVLGGGKDLQIWGGSVVVHWPTFLLASAILFVLMVLLVLVFMPLGQVVSRQLDSAPRPLSAYSWNLAASLAGILAFFAACRSMLPPTFWLCAVIAGFGALQVRRVERFLIVAMILPASLLLHEPSTADRFTVWSPYQELQYHAFRDKDGDLLVGSVLVNHNGYQWIVNLASDFLARHPQLLRHPAELNVYNLPFRFAKASPSVLIVGAGSGNDAAGALRNGATSVDAVEIDPAILEIGKRLHPEKPYQSPRVHVHITDARAFLKRTQAKYDLVLFGLLDSHTELSDYSNVRIDNFVYTEESFREARARLNSDGVMYVKFEVRRPWLERRISQLMEKVFGKPPLVFKSDQDYGAAGICFVISPSDRVEQALASNPALADYVKPRTHGDLNARAEVLTTDDWPYLYQEGRWIPGAFLSVGVLVVLISSGLYMQIPDARRKPPSLFFFSMGAGFLLLETQVISRLALFFGTTWQVNGVVIAALLTALLIANYVIERRGEISRVWVCAGVLGGLLLAYLTPFEKIPGTPSVAGCVAAAFFAIPVFFAGLLFAQEFRKAKSPSAALGANMLGAVLGGLLENASLVFGMRALVLIAMALYFVAAISLIRRKEVTLRQQAASVTGSF
jgi:spermidine synthase